MHMGGAALCKAVDAMLEKGRAIAARLLQTSMEQVMFADGRFAVKGEPDRAIDLLGLARAARDPANLPDDMSPGLDTYVWNLLDLITFPNGCHIAEVEIDPATGVTEVVSYVMVNDFGTLVNPMLVEGQLHGGVIQGIGQALMEHTVFDREGQLVTGSYTDYQLPRAADAPPIFTFESRPQPTANNPIGAKGCGEAGCAGSLPSVMNAVVDALSEYAVRHVDMPATPQAVWRIIQESERDGAAERGT
jgi:carbon-monoxide dehydrogenase large subunit